jgi:Flp pilus assembly protein TadB
MTFAIIFIFAMVLSTSIYLGVQSYFDKRDAGTVHDRLLERAKAGDGTARPSRQEALFEGAAAAKGIGGRIMTWFNMDRRLHQMAEQAGVEWLPGQVVMGSLGLAFVAFNLCWYMLPPGIRYVAFIAAAGASMLPLLYLRRARRKRIDAFEAQFPDAL